jgi:hypothetical protein
MATEFAGEFTEWPASPDPLKSAAMPLAELILAETTEGSRTRKEAILLRADEVIE